ncbi:hypothetical protein G6539_02245 [Streptomyces albidoflavus]|uniref:hypothetical protein n=1 Tax=Streptomyces sp. CS227 TaxID=1982763 RepID=UPI0015C5BDCB|nr:hypothetical protein [Streptomyces sp. CS227]MBL0799497.1 hypothetical protein [Streptomyces albidoflavus]
MYRNSEFAERIGRSASTVRRWEPEDLLEIVHTFSCRRLYGLRKYEKTLKDTLGGGQ